MASFGSCSQPHLIEKGLFVVVVDPSPWKNKKKIKEGYNYVNGTCHKQKENYDTACHREEPFHEKLENMLSAW